ncbi:MAG: VOC family protein [Planctomycetota bacterium]
MTGARVRSIAEVVLNVTDLARSVTFYQEVLGFEHRAQFPEDDPTIVFLHAGSEAGPDDAAHRPMLVLIDPSRHENAFGKFATPNSRTSALNHLAFDIRCEDYEPEQARLESLGIELFHTRFDWLGARAMFFQDPDGNRLELIAREPG